MATTTQAGVPSREAMLKFAKGYVDEWNSGDKAAWIANWKAVAPGDFVMHDPVGTPPKVGFEQVALEPYDLFQPSLHMRINPDLLFVCGNEIAWVMENTFTNNGEQSLLRSMEVYRFGDDGSVEIRTHYDVPEADEPTSGELFATYLPEDT